jgi:DNA-binding transcriptional ArsR family regulator
MQPDRLSATFSALADPTRRAILARLTTSEASVNELAEPFDMSLPAVSKHLKVLEKAGLIARGREAQWRPCRLEAEPLKEIHDWVAEYRRFWEQSFDRLDDYLRELQANDSGNKDVGNRKAANSKLKKQLAPSRKTEQKTGQKTRTRKRNDK